MYLEKYDLSDRTAVITGGGRNIGLACARALAEAGANIIIAEIDERVAASGQAEMRGAGFEAEMIQLDVTCPMDVTAAANQIVKRYGGVDILVCNAGIAFNTPAEEMTDEEWLKVIDINLNGVFWSCRAFGRHMLERGRGSIINIGSMSGVISNKPQPQSHYNASKAAVHMLTKSLAGEWAARGVRVNSVAPTYIETEMTRRGMNNPEWLSTWLEMTPMHRVGQPPEIASVVLFLASDASSLMTGSVVLVDGGYTCW
ncbi:MAG TPA: SDR family oxidoreductase [Blastocatellia bacterium]|jgi:NAD(P)-dependent dehydrogenase (short-subunit alcohol dehydrogenase family)